MYVPFVDVNHSWSLTRWHTPYSRGSQEERILILKLALTHKGVSVADHYDLDRTAKPSSNGNGGAIEEDDSGGLHL